ncbi:MAG: hypothetical protein Q9180_003171 [Flavoplaca navasiana]
MSLQSHQRKSKTSPRQKNNVGGMKPTKGATAIETLRTFLHLYLILETSSILNSSLFPVYGSLPGSRYTWPLELTAFLVAGSVYRLYLFRFSGQLGASKGPLVSGLLTCFPLTLVGAVVANKRLAQKIDEGVPLDRRLPQIITTLLSLAAYKPPNIFTKLLFGTIFKNSRLAFYYLLAISQSLIPSKYLFLAALPVLHTTFFSVYSPLPYSKTFLNTTLQQHGYSLIARQESLTGYISVLDNVKDGFRVMRCDHSLLGGEWFPQSGYETQLREPVYAIFVMLEAVRLVQSVDDSENQQQTENSQESALVVGLGIGTTPTALIAHGIDTTIVEIDPTVHDFATRYFNLPSNHTSVIEDAIAFVDRNRRKKKYEYIIHDVFTGGAEPIDLFTVEFLTGLKQMLTVDGVIAIVRSLLFTFSRLWHYHGHKIFLIKVLILQQNYAGDLHLPSARTIILTILTVFPSCRLFRESPAPATPPQTDFTNLVLFCRQTAHAFTFRQPTEADFLNTQARKHHLLPRYEVDAATFLDSGKGTGEQLVRKNNTYLVRESQLNGAKGHWDVMRSVVPDAVWENW